MFVFPHANVQVLSKHDEKVLFDDFIEFFFVIFDHAKTWTSMLLLVKIHNKCPYIKMSHEAQLFPTHSLTQTGSYVRRSFFTKKLLSSLFSEMHSFFTFLWMDEKRRKFHWWGEKKKQFPLGKIVVTHWRAVFNLLAR